MFEIRQKRLQLRGHRATRNAAVVAGNRQAHARAMHVRDVVGMARQGAEHLAVAARASFLHAEGVVASRSSRIRMQGECS
ncbi:hypothetical protein ACQCQ7_23545, partial [Ralstonia pseudosolanacearum]